MTRREDFAALRRLVEMMAPRPEREAALRLFEFYVLAIAAAEHTSKDIWDAHPNGLRLDPLLLQIRKEADLLLDKLDEEI